MEASDEENFSQGLKIPKDRIAVLIGRKGDEKASLEHLTKCRINVDSKEGDVTIEGTDPLALYVTREIVKAIARGFSPETARLLLKPDYSLELVDMKEYAKTKNDELRLKGRVIGAQGKSRRVVEDLSECTICVYGKTVGIIGPSQSIHVARRAVNMLLAGSTHSAVYRWLETQRRSLKLHKF